MSAAPDTARMPAGIPFIVANEFAERFCFYGINAILVQYMISFLHFGDAKSASWQAMFKAAAYFFPLVGSIVSDLFLAKFRTIISFSMVYVAGCTTLALGSGETMLIIGLLLMAFGTGGIKPCVSTNVGDQFTSANQHLIERAFSYFYLSINAGSSISIYLCPELLNNPALGPKIAFGMPAAMMAFATLVFWLGRKKFAIVPPAMQTGAAPALAVFAVIFLVLLAITGFVLVNTNVLAATGTILALLAGLVWICLSSGVRPALPAELRRWMEECFTGEGLRIIGRLAVLYLFIAFFWSLWDQSNGNSWTIQAQSALMDKRLFGFLEGAPAFVAQAGLVALAALLAWIAWWLVVRVIPFVIDLIHGGADDEERATPLIRSVSIAAGAAFFVWFLAACWSKLPNLPAYQMLPSQVQVVNGLFILILVPIFTFGIYPAMGRFFQVTPLRKIGIGLFTVASSFVVVAWIEQRIQDGHVVSIWWQIFAYVILTAAEVLVSITALEYSYKQAPLRMKSFIMALFLLSTSLGNAFTAAVNTFMVRPIEATAVVTGDATWVTLTDVEGYVPGQKIDFDGDNGVTVKTATGDGPLAGTFLIREIDEAGKRVQLMDKVDRQPIASSGTYDLAKGGVSTYALVGPMYFLFFTALMCAGAVLYIFVAMRFRETTFVREDVPAPA